MSNQEMAQDCVREALAKYAHSAWSGWMRYMFEKGQFWRTTDEGGNEVRMFILPEWAVARWIRQTNTPYADLSEEERESDRKEADLILAIIQADFPPEETIALELDFKKPAVGDVLKVEAVDWGMVNHQTAADDAAHRIVRGVIYGEVTLVDDERITLAPQVFDDGGVRCALTIPWVTVQRVTILEHGKGV